MKEHSRLETWAPLLCHARIGSLLNMILVNFTHTRTHAEPFSVFGRLWSPRVISAYYTLFSKSRRFLTRINAFLRLRHKKAWDGKKYFSRKMLKFSGRISKFVRQIFWHPTRKALLIIMCAMKICDEAKILKNVRDDSVYNFLLVNR